MIKFNSLAKIGICLGVPSVALLLFLIKKSKENSEEDELYYENTLKTRQTTIEVKVPSDCVRTLIGPQGSTIKEIQQKTDTRISFKDRNNNSRNAVNNNSNKKDVKNQDEIFLIRGSNSNVQRAELEIKRIIVDMGSFLTEEYYIPDYVCGRLIGKGGSSIKEICNSSNCKVKINDKIRISNSSDEINTDIELLAANDDSQNLARKLITLTGTTEQIQHAKELIMAKIKEEASFREKRNSANNKKKSRITDFDRYNKDDKSSSYSGWYNNYNNDCENENSETKEETQIINMPKLINLESYLNDDKSVKVVVSAVASPCIFWVQIQSEKDENNRLAEFNQKMNAFYTNNNSKTICHESLSELKIGMLIACKFENSWYRAEVKGFQNTDDFDNPNSFLVDIYVIDYGDSAYLSLNEIKMLDHQFYDFPMQAIECNLYDVVLNEKYNEWTDESINYFEEICYSCKWKQITLKLVEYNNKIPVVKLFDHTKNLDISDLLVSKEYASFKSKAKSVVTPVPNIISDQSELATDTNDQCDIIASESTSLNN